MMKIHFESGPSNLKNSTDKSKVLIMIIETDSRPSLTLPCTMLFYPTVARKYFAKTQTYVALFGPHELSLIFSGGMCLELTSL